jgi:hypothetical protein
MSKRRLQFYLYLSLILIYLVITLLPAPDALVLQHYHLSATSYRLVDLAVVLPFIAIWLIAYYGFSRLRRYSELIANSRDGHQVFRLSQGLMVLAYGLPFAAIANAWLTYLSRHNMVSASMATIVHHYVDVIFPVIAFFVISIGARRLSDQVKARTKSICIKNTSKVSCIGRLGHRLPGVLLRL